MSRPVPTRRAASYGLALAFFAALVSGVSVFVNSYGVKRVPNPTVYTTAKNLVAAVILLGLLVVASRARPGEGWSRPSTRREWTGLAAVALLGGSIPFVLFFEGIARASSTDAQFVHKTLVVWVALLAVPILGERVGGLHVAAVALLVVGQAEIVGGIPTIGESGRGEAMILAATLLWSVEVVVAKRLLTSVSPATLAAARMAAGSLVLVAWLGATGRIDDLVGLSASGWGWAALTGTLLTLYVATWYSALARAQAVDVTAVLMAAVLVTFALDSVVNGRALAPQRTGLLVILAGSAVAGTAAWITARRAAPAEVGSAPGAASP
ncbi:MAG: DMT family transporter [Acidimicrobiia bacterium]|nr:DMT family transporter [Acidimicrobiia bacterium]